MRTVANLVMMGTTVVFAFGHSLESDTANVVKASGGTVVGSVKHPLGASDFSSFLLQAQSSKAQIIGLANAGGDFIKTSTGKVAPAATLPVTLLMLEVVRDWNKLTGDRIGVKPAGGIRSSKDAIKYLVTVAETVGEEWLDPHLFRFGASSLLNDVLLQRQKLSTGRYSGPDYVTMD